MGLTKPKRYAPYKTSPEYDYLKCVVCRQPNPEYMVARQINGRFYFGHQECFHGKSDLQIAGPEQVTIDEVNQDGS